MLRVPVLGWRLCRWGGWWWWWWWGAAWRGSGFVVAERQVFIFAFIFGEMLRLKVVKNAFLIFAFIFGFVTSFSMSILEQSLSNLLPTTTGSQNARVN